MDRAEHSQNMSYARHWMPNQLSTTPQRNMQQFNVLQVSQKQFDSKYFNGVQTNYQRPGEQQYAAQVDMPPQFLPGQINQPQCNLWSNTNTQQLWNPMPSPQQTVQHLTYPPLPFMRVDGNKTLPCNQMARRNHNPVNFPPAPHSAIPPSREPVLQGLPNITAADPSNWFRNGETPYMGHASLTPTNTQMPRPSQPNLPRTVSQPRPRSGVPTPHNGSSGFNPNPYHALAGDHTFIQPPTRPNMPYGIVPSLPGHVGGNYVRRRPRDESVDLLNIPFSTPRTPAIPPDSTVSWSQGDRKKRRKLNTPTNTPTTAPVVTHVAKPVATPISIPSSPIPIPQSPISISSSPIPIENEIPSAQDDNLAKGFEYLVDVIYTDEEVKRCAIAGVHADLQQQALEAQAQAKETAEQARQERETRERAHSFVWPGDPSRYPVECYEDLQLPVCPFQRRVIFVGRPVAAWFRQRRRNTGRVVVYAVPRRGGRGKGVEFRVRDLLSDGQGIERCEMISFENILLNERFEGMEERVVLRWTGNLLAEVPGLDDSTTMWN